MASSLERGLYDRATVEVGTCSRLIRLSRPNGQVRCSPPPMVDALRRVRRRRRRRSGTRLWTCCAGRAGTWIRSEALHRILTIGRPAADRAGARPYPSASPHQSANLMFRGAGPLEPRWSHRRLNSQLRTETWPAHILPKPLLPLLPSVQIFLACFCTKRFTTRRAASKPSRTSISYKVTCPSWDQT